MAVMDAEGLYSMSPNALRLATRGAVKTRQREGTMDTLVAEVAVPLVRLANRVRANGNAAAADSILEHAVHDGIPASALAEAVQAATADDHRDETAPPVITLGPRSELRVGPPPEASDLDSAIELANYVRNRLLIF